MFIVYDDYKFVTKQELEEIGLSYLIGTNLLRAYMHGYFMDIRLYRKAKQITEPFNYEEYKKSKLKEILDKERINRVKIQKLPKVNAELAKRIIDDQKLNKKKSKVCVIIYEVFLVYKRYFDVCLIFKINANVLEDNRFTAMFNDPVYQIDKDSEEYRLLNPVVQKLNEKTPKKVSITDKFERVDDYNSDNDEREANSIGGSSDDDNSDNESAASESSSDDEHTWKEYKKQYNELQKEKKQNERKNSNAKSSNKNNVKLKQPKFYEIKDDVEYFSSKNSTNSGQNMLMREKLKKLPIEKRVKLNNDSNKTSDDVVIVQNDSIGNKQMTFLPRRVI